VTAFARRAAPLRRRGPRTPRRVRQARPIKRPTRVKRRLARIVLLAAVAVALWALWPKGAEVEAPAAVPIPPAKAATKAATHVPPTKSASVLPSHRNYVAPGTSFRARRDLLLAAIRARAPSLRPCVPADAAAVDVPVHLHVTRAGVVKGLEFTGAAPPRLIAECVRGVATGWNFQDVELPSDVELFATLALGPGT
jgi:hypothetical protein